MQGEVEAGSLCRLILPGEGDPAQALGEGSVARVHELPVSAPGLSAYQHRGIDNVRQKGKVTARESLATDVQVLGEMCGYDVKYVLVVKK